MTLWPLTPVLFPIIFMDNLERQSINAKTLSRICHEEYLLYIETSIAFIYSGGRQS